MTTTVIETRHDAWDRSAAVRAVATMNALGDEFGAGLNLVAQQSISVQVTGTFVGALTFEVSNDGIVWTTKQLISAANAPTSSTTGAGIWMGDIGATYFRVRFSAYTSGTATITLVASPYSQYNPPYSQRVAVGTGTTGPQKAEDSVHSSGDAGIFMLGVRQDAPTPLASDAGDYAALVVDRHGAQVVRNLDSLKRTYAAAVKLTTIPTGAPVLEITGAASTTVEINRITATLNGTAAGKVDLTVSKRSTASTGGTSTTPTKVPYDAADSASAATVKAYTVAATTPGTLVGVIRQAMLAVTAANVPSDRLRLESGQYSKSLTLTAAAQTITVEIVGTLPAGAELALDIEWTEF